MILTEYTASIRTLLADSAGARYTTTLLETAVRFALAEYSMASPHQTELDFTVTASGRQQSISALASAGFMSIIEVYHPYDSAAETPVPSEAWYTFMQGSTPAITFTGTAVPQAGEHILIRYACRHTIDDLDSATNTSICPGHESAIILGGCGHAMVLRSAGLTESFRTREADSSTLLLLGNEFLERFRRFLNTLRAATVSTRGPFPPVKWSLDQWDTA